MNKKELLFYNEYEEFYEMARKSNAFKLFCQDAFGEDFSQDGFSNVKQIDMILKYIPKKENIHTDFVLAWGGSLKKNATTNLIKYKILQMLIKNGWENSIKHIITDTLEDDNQIAPHMLWLALHCASESWFVVKCPFKQILEEVSPKDDVVEVPVKNKRTRKKSVKSEQ